MSGQHNQPESLPEVRTPSVVALVDHRDHLQVEDREPPALLEDTGACLICLRGPAAGHPGRVVTLSSMVTRDQIPEGAGFWPCR